MVTRNENHMGLSTTSNYADQINPVNSIYVQSPQDQAHDQQGYESQQQYRSVERQSVQQHEPVQRQSVQQHQPIQQHQPAHQPVHHQPQQHHQPVQRESVQRQHPAQHPAQHQRTPRDTFQTQPNKWEESQYSASSYSNSPGSQGTRLSQHQVIKNNIPGGPRKMRTNRTSHTRSK